MGRLFGWSGSWHETIAHTCAKESGERETDRQTDRETYLTHRNHADNIRFVEGVSAFHIIVSRNQLYSNLYMKM